MSSPDNPQFEPQAPVGADAQGPAFGQGDPFASAAVPVLAGPPPVENPIWSGWDVLAIFALILVTIFVLQLGILFGARALFYPQTSLVDLAQRPLLLLLSQFLIDGAAALYIFFYIEGKYHTDFWPAIRWNWPPSAWKLLGMGAVLLFGLTALQSVLPMPKDTPFDKLFARPRDAYLLALIAVTVAPFVEELFFRGLLYPVIARRWGVAWGIFLTALPFALMHLPQYGYAWGVMLVILIVGVACGMVRAATKSVAASFLIHAGYNGTQMLIAVVVTHGFRTMPKAALWLR